MKKYIAEAIGTAVLVIIGCGTAMTVGCDAVNGGGYILTALAFGIAIVMMAYSIGNISGCHVNPAVSLSMLVAGKMSGKDFIGYVISQVIGAFIGTIILAIIFNAGSITDMTGGYGSNGLAGVNNSALAGFIVEVVLTYIFILAIHGVTSSKAGHGSFGGLVIGITLTGIHILGIGLTGTSVNPARSIAPAVIAYMTGANINPLYDLWIFIAAPLIGGVLAAITYKALEGAKK